MKKLYFGLLAATLVLSLCACKTSKEPIESKPEEPPIVTDNVTEKPTEATSATEATEKPTEAADNGAETEKPTESGSAASTDLTGPWHLDSEKNDLTALQDTFSAYMEFGARMELTSDGKISWYIGIEGGSGTYTQDGDTLTAEIVTDLEQKQMTVPLRVILDGETAQLEMEYNETTVYWAYGEPEAE